MAKISEQFTTTAGTVVRQYRRDDGSTFSTADGSFVSSQSFAAYKSHTPGNQAFSRSTETPESLDKVGGIYQYQTPRDPRSATNAGQREQIGDRNRWVGFLRQTTINGDEYDSPVEAAEAYDDMKDQLDSVTDSEKIQSIKRKFGIGGS